MFEKLRELSVSAPPLNSPTAAYRLRQMLPGEEDGRRDRREGAQRARPRDCQLALGVFDRERA